MQTYQHRVIEERDQLTDKFEKLAAFLAGPIFPTLNVKEQERLQKQFNIMDKYITILNERIDAFL